MDEMNNDSMDYSYVYDYQVHEDEEYYRAVEKKMWVIGGFILIVVGTIGNFLSIAVLTRPNMRRSNAAVYLIVLAFSDLAALYTGLLRRIILHVGGYDIRELSEAGCKIHMTVVYFFLDLSSWLLAALSLERLFSVCRPLSVKTTCTRRTSFAIISVIVIVLLGLNAHFLFTHGELTVTFGDQTRTFSCISLTDDYFHFFAKVWPWIDLSVFALFPLIIQVIANTLIVTRVIISYRIPGRAGTSRKTRAVALDSVNSTASSTKGLGGRASVDSSVSIISIESQATTSFGATSSTPGARGSVTFLGIDNETPSASEFQSQQHPATGNDASSGDKETSCVDDGEKVKNATSSASAQAGGRSTGAQNRKDTTGQQMKNKTEKKTSSASTKPSPDRRRSSAAQQDKIVSSMTIMLVAVSLTFCVCTIPISVFVIHSFIEPDYHPRLRVVWVAVNLAMYTNNACNFILYSLSGSRFRAEMKRMWQVLISRARCLKRRRHVQRRTPLSTLASSHSSSIAQSSRSSTTETSACSVDTVIPSTNTD